MAVFLPIATTKLSEGHSKLHRVIAVDLNASDEAVAVSATDDVTVGNLFATVVDVDDIVCNIGLGVAGDVTVGKKLDISGDVAIENGLMARGLSQCDNVDLPTGLAYPSNIPSACRVWLDADQDIANTTDSLIEYENETFDVNNEFNVSTHLFTAKQSGLYQLYASLMFLEAPADGTLLRMWFEINGAATAGYREKYPGAAGLASITVADLQYLTTGDTVGCAIRHAHGSNRELNGQYQMTYMTIVKIA